MLGVSFDPPERNLAFAAKHGLRHALLSDEQRTMALAYRACDSPRDAFPRRVTYVVGPDGLIEEALETGSPGDQAAELLERLPVAPSGRR